MHTNCVALQCRVHCGGKEQHALCHVYMPYIMCIFTFTKRRSVANAVVSLLKVHKPNCAQ